MSMSLVLKPVIAMVTIFFLNVMFTSALQPCNSTVDCDNGYICCKITKICVSKCNRTVCRNDSDCKSGEYCVNDRCTDENCSIDKILTIVLIVCGVTLAPIIFLLYICYSYYKIHCGSMLSKMNYIAKHQRKAGKNSVRASGFAGGGYGGREGGGGCGGDGGGGGC